MDPPRCFGRAEVYAPTGAEAAAFDRWAIEESGVPAAVLMENAGRGAAAVVSRICPEGTALVVAGKGNNGGDGLVLARSLVAEGREVKVLLVGDRPAPDPLLHGWPLSVQSAPRAEDEFVAVLGEAGVVVDALLGTGTRGAPREPQARAIRAINRSTRRVVSLDVPSGVDAASGAVPGEAVRAEMTIAFGAPKLGTLLFPGRQRAGRLVTLEIGFPPLREREMTGRLITPDWAELRRPRRPLVTHKKAEGQILVVAGSSGLAGAAVLAVRGALRAGAGYVRVASHPDNREILQSRVPEAVFVNVLDSAALAAAARESDAVAAGPGIGVDEGAGERLDALLRIRGLGGVVLDADALTLLGAGRLPAFSQAAVSGRRLLTPHPGEMARLGEEPEDIRSRPVEVCRRGAKRLRSALLLKGQPSLITGPEGETVWLSSSGSSDLARAGVGDVLTGVAGAFLARGTDALEAGALALHYTGRSAAISARGEALLASDIADHMDAAFSDPTARCSDLGLPFVLLDLDPSH